jgi:hypothetical protein
MGVLGLKIFVVLLGIALIASTLLGILIALNTRPARRVGIIMLVAGTVLPIVLLKLYYGRAPAPGAAAAPGSDCRQ